MDFPALADVFETQNAEVDTLMTHSIELLWVRSMIQGEWEQVAAAWQKAGPKWVRDSLSKLRERLIAQTALTMPSKKYPLLPETSAEEMRKQSDLAELWLLHLYGRSKDVCAAVERLIPAVSGDTHHWRVLGDFAYLNAAAGTDQESAGVHLARRRRLAADTPLLIFNDKREQRINELLRDLFRARSEAMAARRREVLILSVLQELSALRLWDFGMWCESAIGSQAELLLETAQWSDEAAIAGHALVLTVQSLQAKDPEKDGWVRGAINRLEFAPPELLRLLAEGLIVTYPLQKHAVASLLKDITDLLPEATWPDLARWTMSYAQESAEGRTTGQQLAPVAHWLWALATLPQDSDVWDTLQPLVLALTRISHCWHGGDTKDFLRRWLIFAPVRLAREVAEEMIDVPETNAIACIKRTELLINFEEWRPELQNAFTHRLVRKEVQQTRRCDWRGI